MLIFPEQNQISVLRQRSPARKSHSKRVWADAAPGRAHKKHDYCCSPFSFTIRATFSDETSGLPEVVALPRCKAELLPCQLVFDLRPFQYWQYASLRTAMFSQQRLDTMLHKRPSCRPTSNPSAWWRYAIGCVMARPNSRPWRDVLKIVKCRSRYFYLVKTKLLNASTAGGGSGFHAGLLGRESEELLALEELLPIEALLSFHLLALRDVVKIRLLRIRAMENKVGSDQLRSESFRSPDRKSKSSGLSRIRRAFGGGGGSSGKGGRRLGSSFSASPDNEIFQVDNMEEQLLSPGHGEWRGPVSFETEFIPMSEQEKKDSEPPMHLAFETSKASFSIRLLETGTNNPVLCIDAQTSGIVRSHGDGKKELKFDLKRFEIVGMNNSINRTILLTVKTPEDTHHNGDGADRQQGDNVEGSKKHGGEGGGELNFGPPPLIPKMKKVSNMKADLSFMQQNLSSSSLVCKTPDEIVIVDKQPDGVVCRVLASVDQSGVVVSVSAQPATLIWNKECLDAIADSFASQSPEMRSVLRGQLKNAATPLAHRAQLALMSPTSITLRANIDAPKLWVPITSEVANKDGSVGTAKESGSEICEGVFLDAGRIKINILKAEGVNDTNWDMFARDMQVKFVRGKRAAVPHIRASNDSAGFCCQSPTEEIPVVYPLHINLVANIFGEKERDVSMEQRRPNATHSDSMSKISVTIGDVRLNLADVDVLARGIGKWSAAKLLRVRQRNKSRKQGLGGYLRKENSSRSLRSLKTFAADKERKENEEEEKVGEPALEMVVSAKKVEMTLEGFSKTVSVASGKVSEPQDKRTYLVQLLGIEVNREKCGHQTSSQFTLEDVSVVQMRAYGMTSHQSPALTTPPLVGYRRLQPSEEARHQVLARAAVSEPPVSSSGFGRVGPNPPFSPHKQVRQQYPQFTSPQTFKSNTVSSGLHEFETPSMGGATDPHARRVASEGTFDSSLFTAEEVVNQSCSINPILSLSHLHDGKKHLDEVEIDVEAFVVRVTPISLKDCAQCLRRIVDLGQLMTQEMERKIHEEGRTARKLGSKGEIFKSEYSPPLKTR